MISAALAGGGGSIENGRLRIVLSPAQLMAVLEKDTIAGDPASRSATKEPDVGVPIAGAAFAGAIRVATVTGGRIGLMKHEVISGIRLGSCSIDLSDGVLHTRAHALARNTDEAEFTSTFDSLLAVERSLALSLRIKSAMVENWLRTAPRGRALAFSTDAGRAIGKGLLRGSDDIRPMTRIEVRLTRETYNGRPYVIAVSRPSA